MTSLISDVIDKETQEKIDIVKARLIKYYEIWKRNCIYPNSSKLLGEELELPKIKPKGKESIESVKT